MNTDYNNKSIDAVLSRLETKVDAILNEISEIKKDNKELTKRVSALEYFKYYLAGIAACSGVFGSLILSKIKNLLT